MQIVKFSFELFKEDMVFRVLVYLASLGIILKLCLFIA